MEMLAEVLGVAKPSIYANFGSKKALFLEALENYHNTLVTRISNGLHEGGLARDGLNKLLCELIAPSSMGIRRGCLATNAVLEMPDLDSDIRIRINKTFHEILRLFTEAIRRGQQEGEIRNDRPAAELAQFIVSSVEGVRVLERTSVDMSRRAELAWLTLSVLDQATNTRDRPPPRVATTIQSSAGRKTHTGKRVRL